MPLPCRSPPFFFFFLDIFIGQLPPSRPPRSLALLLASGDQTRGAAGPSDLTDGAEAHILALFLHGHGNIIIQMRKKNYLGSNPRQRISRA